MLATVVDVIKVEIDAVDTGTDPTQNKAQHKYVRQKLFEADFAAVNARRPVDVTERDSVVLPVLLVPKRVALAPAGMKMISPLPLHSDHASWIRLRNRNR